NQTQTEELLTKEHLNAIANAMRDAYDWGYGGWGDAPKFPQAMAIEFLLHHSVVNNADEYQKLITHCLNVMARGGMYDVVGGGFSRYSTDNLWRVPHFEKMLYDNALLVRAYLHAWQVTKNPFYKRIVQETLDFVAREMTHKDGGFYSSLDADSEGEEGKFYVWTQDEIKAILKNNPTAEDGGGSSGAQAAVPGGDDYDFFEAAYGITAQGNWEGKTVLQRALDDSSLAARFKLDVETVTAKLAESHAKLLSVRNLRIRPGTDDKVLTAWNGLMLAGFAEAARVFALESNSKLFDSKYYNLAARNAEFLLSKLRPNKKLVRAWRDGKTTDEVFLEDYAALILGLLELYQTDFDNKWFASAKELADEMIEKFSDSAGGFFDTPNDSENLLFRPKDVQDNATPCGNSLACEALIKLAEYTGEGKYRDLAEKSLSLITSFTLRYPLGFARW
ncbi:MAG: thioredoxin domain-containing protein, partial [Anaerolineales bacterium]